MKYWVLLVLLCLYVGYSTAQDAAESMQSYVGDSITFQLPASWQIDAQTPNRIFIGNGTTTVEIFVSAQTTAKLTLGTLISQLASGLTTQPIEVVTVPINDQEAKAIAFTEQALSWYLLEWALSDGGVVLVRSYADNNGDRQTVNAIFSTIAPTQAGSRAYESINSEIVFRQPLDYSVNEPGDNFLIVSNTPDSLPVPNGDITMRDGTFQMLIFTDMAQVPNYTLQEGDTPQDVLLAYLNKNICSEACTFSDYENITLANQDGAKVSANFQAMDAQAYALDLVNGGRVLVGTYAPPQQMATFQPIADIVLNSLTYRPIQVPQVADITTDFANFRVAHPQGWVGGQADDNLYIVSNVDQVPTEFNAEQMIAYIFPNFATFKAQTGYPSDLTVDTKASTLVSYFASLGIIQGNGEQDAMEIGTLADRDFSSVVINVPNANYSQVILVLSDGAGDFVAMIALMRDQNVSDWQPLLQDIISKSGNIQ